MLTKLSDDEVRAELESSNRVFGEATGSAAKPVLFRPPVRFLPAVRAFSGVSLVISSRVTTV